ncbi:MAG TPA: PIN domain-containing protein [Pseudomonadales bacterium]
MIWAFVDYENVGTLEGLKLADYERIFVFCGPKNPRVKIGAPPADQFCRMELIGITTIGPNNLDFHLAFHLGRLHEVADKSVIFHIVSSDGDFNGLVNHLKKIGRSCKKISLKGASKPVEKPAPVVQTPALLSDCASLVVERLQALDGRKRPRKKDGLLNWIKSQCQGMAHAVPSAIYAELIDALKIRQSGSDVSYDVGR